MLKKMERDAHDCRTKRSRMQSDEFNNYLKNRIISKNENDNKVSEYNGNNITCTITSSWISFWWHERTRRRRCRHFLPQHNASRLCCNQCFSFYNKFNTTGNKLLLITIILLLITTIVATICQCSEITTTATSTTAIALATTGLATQMAATTRLHKKRSTTITALGLVAAFVSVTGAAAAALTASAEQLQQRQYQQQQLFAMLTKNAAPTVGVDLRNGNVAQRHVLDDDRNSDDAAVSLETLGFVSDDGDQRYEKAEKALAAAAAAAIAATSSNTNGNRSQNNGGNSGSNKDCPKECTCLNDYFDCSKKHLDRVPTLPSYVQTLDLIGNKLNDTTVLQIRNLSGLIKLTLKRNQLDTMPIFTGLTSLRQLNIANNRIQRISTEALIALPKLKSLDLSKNYLHTLESNYFPETNRLAFLILNGNEISSIDENAFDHLSGLLDLELKSNHLTSLPAGVFRNLNKLKKLVLNNNHLEINWSTFKGLQSLQKISLQANNIRALQDGVFHVMRGIESIELDHNDITSLSRQGLYNLTKLHHLSLSNNSISRIELDTWEFTQSLVSLDLSYNNISEFKPQHLDCLQHLRTLNLGHNKIQYFADGTFDCVKNLEDLNLRRNKLAWIIEDQGALPPFKALRKLKKLDLFGNNLKQINSKSLIGLNSLEQLNLGGNALASIQSNAFEHMTHLQKLIFKSMNFICDCEILWFRRWLQAKSKGSPQMQKNAICGYPEQLIDRELLTLTSNELICADSPKPVITQEPSNQLAVKGANVTMECIANSPAAASMAAADELKIKWRHDNQNLRERGSNSATSTPAGPTPLHNHHHNMHHHHHNHHGISNSYSTTETQVHHDQSTNQTTIIGYLRLYNVSYDSAGRYQCVVANAFGTTYSQKFKISIGIHPTFLQIPSNLTIDSGDTARLVCSATGDPMPEIALQKFGASDFPAATDRRLQVIREENAFLITNAKPIDTGIYTCTAESAAGEIKINASLIVNDKPQPSIPLVRKEVVLGASSVLECLNEMAVDLQRPRREWYKDNKPFHTSTTSASERYYFTTEKELLVIVNTQAGDAGHYRCDINDDAKTHTLQIELIVVKEDFNQNLLIIGIVLVTAVCIIIGYAIVRLVLFYQKRKMYLNAARAIHGSSARIAAANNHRTLSGSRGSALDQTQLTTLNRTYLRPQIEQAMRPRSLADLEMNGSLVIGSGSIDAEQRNCLIVASTPSYQQQLRHPALHQQRYEATIDAYLRRNSLNDADHQQDHLSSKDSGTGSDAAVKRSIDDFTIALLPLSASNETNNQMNMVPTFERNGKTTENADAESFEKENDSEPDFATTVVGISDAVEMCEFTRNGNLTTANSGANHESTTSSFDSNGIDGVHDEARSRRPLPPLPNAKCKQDLSTSFSANTTTLPTTQTVDI